MASKKTIEQLQLVIHQLHGCDSKHLESVPVHEVFRGKTVWKGAVEVFEVNHPKTNRCYGWSHLEGEDDSGQRFVTVLCIPPVDSPLNAVRASIVADGKKRQKS